MDDIRMEHGKLVDLTEYKLKKLFVESINTHIALYNTLHESMIQYHYHAIVSHQTTACCLGWQDVSLSISIQCVNIQQGSKPKSISL